MTALNKAIMLAARSEVGTWEWAEGHNPAVLAYFRDSGNPQVKDDETPWCAAFVGAILGRCGANGTRSLAARSYLQWGDPVEIEDAIPGDVVILWRGQRDGWQGHVGFFAAHGANGALCLLGGNQRDQVNITGYARDRLLGIRRARPPRPIERRPAQSKTVREAAKAGAGTILAQLPDAVEIARPALPILDRLPLWTLHAVAALGVALALWGVVEVIRERMRKAREGDR